MTQLSKKAAATLQVPLHACSATRPDVVARTEAFEITVETAVERDVDFADYTV